MKIDAATQETLRTLEVRPDGDGWIACIPASLGQLERKAYERLNGVLAAAGGAWSRKKRGHLFREDPRAALGIATETGAIRTAKDDDYFPTQPEVARQLVGAALAGLPPLTRATRVLEPSAGEGALLHALFRVTKARRLNVLAVERDPKRRAVLRASFPSCGVVVSERDDFLVPALSLVGAFGLVLMNPPFSKAGGGGDYIAHVLAAWDLVAPGGRLAAILPTGARTGTRSRQADFGRFLETHVRQCIDLPPDAFKASGTMVRTCIVVLDKEVRGDRLSIRCARADAERRHRRRADVAGASAPQRARGDRTRAALVPAGGHARCRGGAVHAGARDGDG